MTALFKQCNNRSGSVKLGKNCIHFYCNRIIILWSFLFIHHLIINIYLLYEFKQWWFLSSSQLPPISSNFLFYCSNKWLKCSSENDAPAEKSADLFFLLSPKCCIYIYFFQLFLSSHVHSWTTGCTWQSQNISFNFNYFSSFVIFEDSVSDNS